MTGATLAPAGLGRRAAFRPATFADVLRSEWTKLRSVRSTFWALTVTVVLCISSEYSSGMIRTSLIAVPKRGRVLAAKALVVAGVTFVVGEATSFAAFFTGQALISGHAPHAALGDPGVARAVVGAGLLLTALAVLSVAAGTLLRHPAAAIASMMAVALVLPAIAQALPDSWRYPVTEFWPTQVLHRSRTRRGAAVTGQPGRAGRPQPDLVHGGDGDRALTRRAMPWPRRRCQRDGTRSSRPR